MLFLSVVAAIPDFQSGAMENWGLTTYRETGLLFDPEKSSASDKLAITKVIAHELAHQVAASVLKSVDNMCYMLKLNVSIYSNCRPK